MSTKNKILIVDDESIILEEVERAVNSLDCIALAATGHDQALDVVKRHGRPHACVIDFVLPSGPDGIALAEKLRAEGIDSPIIFITANEKKYRHLVGKIGFFTLLEKPFSREAMRGTIQSALHFYETQQALFEARLKEELATAMVTEFGWLHTALVHDIKNCLAPALLAVSALKGFLEPTTSPLSQSVSAVFKQELIKSELLLQHIDKICKMGCLAVKQGGGQHKIIDCREVLSDLRKMANEQCSGTGISIKGETCPNPCWVRIDPLLLELLLLDVYINAKKHTEAGHIEIQESVAGTEVWITITDTGRGMAPEVLAKLFLLGEQRWSDYLKTGSWERNTEIGLWLLKLVIERHGGRIPLPQSEPGKGTRIQIILPLAQPCNE